MKKFMDEDFLIQNETGKELFHEVAEKMPIYDFNNRLDAKDIYEDKRFEDLTDAWLGQDHYKWRLMRINGYTQEQIVGDKTNSIEKFQIWANTVGHLFGNPAYQWAHMELKRYFDIDDTLNSTSSIKIFRECNEIIKSPEFSVRNILSKMNIYAICTKNGPTDDLRYHDLLAKDEDFNIKVLPTFSPRRAFLPDSDDYAEYISSLSKCAGLPITNVTQLKFALMERLNYFIKYGCVASDHTLDTISFSPCSDEEADAVFKKGIQGQEITGNEIHKFQSNLLSYLGRLYTEKLIVMQLHIGALCDVNSSVLETYGPDYGYACVDDRSIAAPLVNLLDSMAVDGILPKSIFHTLNDSSNVVLPSIVGCFQDGTVRGKLQYGTAIMSNGNISNINRLLSMLANTGMLSAYIGTTNDARSYLSFPRHEYFRRILCNYVGKRVEKGEFPRNMEYLKEMVGDICFNNAKRFFEDRGFVD